jgi:molecular chaperone GrpE
MENNDNGSTKENKKNDNKKLKDELEECKRLANQRFEDIRYLHADFENLRKQFNKEKEQIIKLSNENLIKELMVILDDFEGSIKLVSDDINKEGLINLQKKFFLILQLHGLKQIESMGKKFDPNFHEVLCKEMSEHDEDEVIEEIQKGYMLHSKVIRPSKVKVSKKDLKINKETIINKNNSEEKK